VSPAPTSACHGRILHRRLGGPSDHSHGRQFGWFERGFVTYANEAKVGMLGVRPETLQEFGAVSHKEQKMDDNKSKALQAALAQIEKQFGKGSIMRMGDGLAIDDIQTVSTGSLGLDIAWASAACRAAGWSRSTARNPPARPR
jgi:hypothetical protein